VFERAKQRRERRHLDEVEAIPNAIEGVRELREKGFSFEPKPVFVGRADGTRTEVAEVVFGNQHRPGTYERTKMIATAIAMETGKHRGIVGDPVELAARLNELINRWPDGLPAVYAEIDAQVETWRNEGVADEQIRTNLILSPDLLQSHNLDVDDVFPVRQERNARYEPAAISPE
jgi:hypothetical protein